MNDDSKTFVVNQSALSFDTYDTSVQATSIRLKGIRPTNELSLLIITSGCQETMVIFCSLNLSISRRRRFARVLLCFIGTFCQMVVVRAGASPKLNQLYFYYFS